MIGLFNAKECKQCQEYEKELDTLTLRNSKLERALRKLKQQYDELLLQTKQNQKSDAEETSLTSTEVDALFAKIKASSYDKDKKRYLRSLLMLIKNNYNPSLHNYLKSQLQT